MTTPCISIYDPHSRRWQFQRRRDLGFRLFALSSVKTVIKRPTVLSDVALSNPDANTRKWRIKCLVQDAPEMGVALPWVDKYLEESRLLTAETTSRLDPAEGRKLVFGIAGSSRKDGILNVAAFVAGSYLGLTEIHQQKRVFNSSNTIVEVPQIIQNGMLKYPISSHIQQLCFAGNPYQSESTNPYLAIRTSDSTKVYRSHYQESPVSRENPSRLSLELLSAATISGSSGEVSHADVSFNPYCNHQFGTIDQRGKWKIWDIEGRYDLHSNNNRFALKHSVEGQIATRESLEGDNWGRIAWGEDFNSVMACDRHTLALFDTRTEGFPRTNISLPLDRGYNWILDMKRGPTNDNGHDSFVLTSSKIIWIDVRKPGQALLSWPHYRHRNDASLYLELFHSNDASTAMIGSNLSPLTTCYQFRPQIGQISIPALFHHPYMIPPPFFSDDSSMIGENVTLLPCPAPVPELGSGLGEYRFSEEKFFVGYSIDRESEITQRIYRTTLGENLLSNNNNSVEFIMNSNEQTLNQKSLRRNKKTTKGPNNRRANFFELYEHAFIEGEDKLRTVQAGDPENSVDGFCETLAGILAERSQRGILGVSSLIDARGPSFLFDNIYDFGIAIERLLGSILIRDAYEIKSLLPKCVYQSLLISKNSRAPSVEEFYENLVNTRVTSLPEKIPGRARLRRERISRLMAIELFLASVGINVKPSEKQLTPPKLLLAKLGLNPITPPAEPIEHSLLQNNEESSIATNFEEQKEPLQKIRAYTHVQVRTALPNHIQDMLDSWKVGEDPRDCEYYIDAEKDTTRYSQGPQKLRKEKRMNSLNRIPAVVGGSQPQIPVSSQNAPRNSQGSSLSQNQGIRITTNKPERSGKHGGRKPKKRKTGF